jgi:catechol 2,3-dioxygenase-like lactoylglutathione lyase family enzyme
LLKDATRLVTEGHGDDLLRIPNRRFPSFISAATFLDMAETPIEYKDFFGIKISNPGITKIQCPILAFYGTNGDVGNEDDLELLESCIRKHSAKPGQLKTRMIRNADHMYSGEEDQVANILTEWIDGLPEMAGVRESIRSNDTMPKVTGIGGIFFLSKDPKAAREWYGKNLGLSIDDYGSVFEFRNGNRPDEINYLRWSPFEEGSDYLKPSEKDFMINYRVQNMEALVKQLRDDGVTIVDGIEEYEYGKFVHILDPEGNKIELWEPVDSVLTRLGGPSTK